MVRRSHRFDGEATPSSQQVLQATQYRYAPPGRRLSTEFESPLSLQSDVPEASPMQRSLRTLDLPPHPHSTADAGGVLRNECT